MNLEHILKDVMKTKLGEMIKSFETVGFSKEQIAHALEVVSEEMLEDLKNEAYYEALVEGYKAQEVL